MAELDNYVRCILKEDDAVEAVAFECEQFLVDIKFCAPLETANEYSLWSLKNRAKRLQYASMRLIDEVDALLLGGE
jgi:hypothetical protein